LKTLFLTQVLPYPLDAGPKVRAYHTLRHMAERHSLTLATFVRDSDRPPARAHVAEYCEQVVALPMPRARWRDALAFGRSLTNGQPFLITRDYVGAMHRAVADLGRMGGFDFVHADQLWMAPYALAARAAAPGRRPKLILDQHNAVYKIPERLAAATRNPIGRAVLRREMKLMARYEAAMCRAFDQVVTVTDEDRDALRGLVPHEAPKIAAVIPICVAVNGRPKTEAPIAGMNVLFVGGMHWPPNADGVRWFVREVWPAVRASAPQAEFWAIGKQPPVEIAAAEQIQAQGWHATGYVEEVEAHWQAASVFVVPLRAGGGMRVKILDAWQRGLPVVSTTVGAEGLRVSDGDNVLLADTPAAFAQATVRVLTDSALAGRLAEAGYATLKRHYDWRTVYSAWDEVYATA
jgi:glycosyltransferase involved in cell wall biosynthesis